MQQEIYNSQVPLSPPQISGDTYGANVGQALQGLGAQTQSSATDIAQYAERQNNLWAVTSAVKAKSDIQKQIIQATLQPGGIPEGFYDQISSALGNSYKSLVKQAPSQGAKNALTMHFAEMGSVFGEHAMRLEAQANMSRNIQGTASAISDAVGAGAYDDVHNILKASNGVIPPASQAAITDGAQKQIEDSQFNNSTPDAQVDGIDKGKFNSVIPDAAKVATKNSIIRNQSISFHAANAQVQNAVQGALSKIENGATEDEAGISALRQQAITIAGTSIKGLARGEQQDKAAQSFNTSLNDAHFVYQVKQDLLSTPLSQYKEKYQAIVDKYGSASHVAQVVGNLANSFSKQAFSDPVAYVLNDQNLSKEYNTALKSNDPNQIQSAIGKVVSAQELAGLPVHAFSIDQATNEARSIRAMLQSGQIKNPDGSVQSFNATDAVAKIQGYSTQYGQYTTNVLKDIFTLPDKHERVPLETQYIASLPQNDPRAIEIANGILRPKDEISAKGEKIQKTWSGTSDEKFDQAISANDTWNQFATANSDSKAFVLENREMLHRQADAMIGTNKAKDVSSAVSQAISNTIGGTMQFSNGLQIPQRDNSGKQIDGNIVSEKLNVIKEGIVDNGMLDTSSILGERAKDANGNVDQGRVADFNLKNTGWVTTQDGRGAQLMKGQWSGGWFGTGQSFQKSAPVTVNGKPVVIDYDTVSSTPFNMSQDNLLNKSGYVPYSKEDITKMFRPASPEPILSAEPVRKAESVQKNQISSLDERLPDNVKGLGSVFEQYGSQYGIDPALLAAISMHETGMGTSSAFNVKNNAMGVSPNGGGPRAFNSKEESVAYMAQRLASSPAYSKWRQSGNLADLASAYAPIGADNDPGSLNKDWLGGVSKLYRKLKGNA